MQNGSITKWLLLGFAIVLLFTYGKKAIFPTTAADRQPRIEDETSATENRPAEGTCTIHTGRFNAVLSTQGASLRHLYLTESKYTRPVVQPADTLSNIKHLVTGDGKGSTEPADLVTTSRAGRSSLRVDLRAPGVDGGAQQVPFDDLDWALEPSDGHSCVFTYKDAQTELRKVVSAGTASEPFQLLVDLTIKNIGATTKKHRFTIEEDAYRTSKEMESHLGRQSEFMTEALAVTSTKTEREDMGEFKPSNFTKPEFTGEHWRRSPGEARAVAVSNVYFTQLVMPEEGPGSPVAETLAEEVWNWQRYNDGNKEQDPDHGYVFRARAAYPEKDLASGESAHYRAIAFNGPKERDLLAALDARKSHGATEVLNLGTFATIARYLVKYLYVLHGIVNSWGWSIVLLTVTVRIALFPLGISQIKNSMVMRRLKPEMDAIKERYKDDTAQQGLATQELMRKNGVNMAAGCAPMLLQMPVWWALYTALQTAVELYHVPFGPVIPDLSSPGRYLIIPAVLGASSFFQQRLMPAQGDAQQQKMLMYMMPAVFTFMMLFLPAGLGVYMVTNSVLAITQQLLVERYLKGKAALQGASSSEIVVREKASQESGKAAPALGKGKARVRG